MNEPPTDSGTSSDDSQEDVSTSSIQHHKKPEKMESVILTDKEQSSAPTYTLYKRRWFMVFIFSSVCAANNILWLTFSTVGQTAITYYHTDAFSIDVHSIIFQAVATLFMMIGSWLCEIKGLRFALLLAAGANLLGGWIRCIAYFVEGNGAYWIVVAGGGIASLAQPVMLVGCTKVAADWFGPKERTNATGIASLSNLLGMALSYLLSSLIVTEGSKFALLYLVQALICTASFALVLFGYQNKPPTPPSHSSAGSKEDMSWKTIKSAFKQRSFVILWIAFGFTYGSFAGLFSILFQIFTPEGLSQQEAGYFGIGMILAGIVGAGIFGTICDKTRRYKLLMVVVASCATIFAVYLFISLYAISFNKGAQLSALMLCGFFAIAALPIAMEAAVESTYPVPEVTSSGLLMESGNFFSIIFIVVVNLLQDAETLSMINGMRFLLVCLGVSVGLLFFFSGPYKRLEYERKHAVQSKEEGIELP